MRGFPRSPWLPGVTGPSLLDKKPSLSDPESTRCYLPAANKNPLGFTSVCLSVRGTCQEGQNTQASGSSKTAHLALGALDPLRGVAGMGTGAEWSLQGGLGPRGHRGLSPQQPMTPSSGGCGGQAWL